MRRAAAILFVLALAACSEGPGGQPSAPSFAPAADAGTGPFSVDAGSDAGASDGDAGSTDAGPSADGGTPGDGGSTDGGTSGDGGSSDGGTAGDGGSSDGGTSSDGGPADGGSTADGGTTTDGGTAACPPGMVPFDGGLSAAADPASGCADLVPQIPSCVVEVAACSGVAWDSPMGPTGTYATEGATDWNGALALACENADVGPRPGYHSFAFDGTAWTGGPQLGERVVGQPDGFVAVSSSYSGTPTPTLDFFDGAGARLASVPFGAATLIASPLARFVVESTPPQGPGDGYHPRLRAYSQSGQLLATTEVAGAATEAPQLVGRVDVSGRVLVVSLPYTLDRRFGTGQWFEADGSIASARFQVQLTDANGGPATIDVAAALAGGGIALGSSENGAKWLGVVAAGDTTVRPVPAWLASRGIPMGFVRSARALLFALSENNSRYRLEIVSAGGAQCGSVTVQGRYPSLGEDGSLIVGSGDKTFKVFPGLLR